MSGADRDRQLETLKAFLRIPSVSTEPARLPDISNAAEFVSQLLDAAGMENIQFFDPAKTGRPLVYGDWLHAPGKPTLLFYGHYDVQPPEPLEEWISPPFEPEIRGDNIHARGAADDKGLTLVLLEALRRYKNHLPVNVRCLIEGEEESGGDNIGAFVAARPEMLKADAAVICDTEMFAAELPTICVGLRGIVYGELHVEGARQDLHSGVYGGVAPNPLMAIAEILTALKSRDGHIRIPGFYDEVTPPAPEERAAWARLPFDEKHYLDTEIGARALTGEAGCDVFERTWARPTLEVHGIRGGFTGEGAKTVIPARAVAKLSFRIVPDQTPEEVLRQVQGAVKEACPAGVTARFEPLHSAVPSVVDPGGRFVQAGARAMTEVFGNETVFTRSGGSIPVVGLFNRHLGIPSVMLGYGLPDDNLHAPNEKLYLPNFFRGIDATARFIELVGQLAEKP